METIEKRDLKQEWAKLKEEQPKLRIRNAANALKVAEVQLLATQIGDSVIRLKSDFSDILKEIESLEKVTAITRNDFVVHERKGVYLNPSFHGPAMGLFVGEDIDLRMFLSCWDSVFSVVEPMKDSSRRSIQFFAKDGEAVHKIYLNDDSNIEAYNTLVEKYKSDNQESIQNVEKKKAKPAEKPDSEIDVKGFKDSWNNLKDTHDFYMMLKKYQVTRTQGIRLAPSEMVTQLKNTVSRELLNQAADSNVPIMVFVGNQGMIQIHTGEVNKLMEYGEWYNVLDPDFNLHLKEEAIHETWLVKKPTEDGTIHAVEVYDKEGELIVQFFGKRKPGIPELKEWQAICNNLEMHHNL